jgi:hypothetical protein
MDDTLRLWDGLSGKPLKEIHLGVPIYGVACTQNMIVIAAGEGLLAIEINQL